jgi:pimeloyl-ACP methyl ester carboxylesterase
MNGAAASVRIAWEANGEGPPLLLVHGLGYTRHGWGPLPDLLSDSFRVVAYDNRGIGDSDRPEGPYTTVEMADDAARVLDEAGLRSAHVVGTSLGGMVAQELALRHPERVDKLVLACTTPGGDGAFPIPQGTLDLIARMPTLAPLEALRLAVENALAEDADESLVGEVFAYRVEHPPDPAGWQAQAAAALTHAVDGRLGDIRAPTLIVHGTADKVVDVRNAQLLRDAIPGARMEIFEGGGHLFFWEQPEKTLRVLKEFLA